MNRIEVGKQYMADLLAKVPEESREAVSGVLLGSEDVLGFVGDSTLRQSDYSRNMNALQDKHRELTTWYETNKSLLDAAVAAGLKPGQPGQPPAHSTGFSREDAEALVNDREKGAAAFMAVMSALTVKHFQEFGETLDTTTLLNLMGDPDAPKIGLEGVYQRKFQDRYKAKADKALEETITSRVQTQLAEERKKLSSAPPYPVTPHEPSPLDVLEAAPNAPGALAQQAADEYTALVARRLATGTSG